MVKEVKQSFSKTHTPYDNAVSESFFSTMKREELYRAKYKSEREFKQAVSDYITFYNEKRPHKYLNY
ncbi:MAG: integrase core domain-containing protein [Ruminococcus sp.]|nr:integrase core domain-containing protein [Ruminococcus sp.]